VTQNLEELRKEIDNIDDEIISLLSKRKGMSKKIAEIKKELNKPIFDKDREQQIIGRLKEKSKEKGLDENFIISLYGLILKNSRDEQKNQD
jgi:chorismate mutase